VAKDRRDLAQTPIPSRFRARRALELTALLVMVLLLLSELALQWSKRRSWTTYTTANGLAGNWVSSIAVGPNDTLWVATTDQSDRFTALSSSTGTGESWTTYALADGLPAGRIYSIEVARDGAVWVATRRQVSRFRGSVTGTQGGESWTTYSVADSLGDNYITSIAVAPDGAVWVADCPPLSSNRGISRVSRFDGETWSTCNTQISGVAHNCARAIDLAPDGVVWVGTWGRGVHRLDGETWSIYSGKYRLGNDRITSIAVAPDGAVWAGTNCGGVSRFDGETWTTYTETDGLHSDCVDEIAVAPDGALWFFSVGRVISRFDGETWSAYARPRFDNTARWNASDRVAFDSRNRLWIGTDGDGLKAFDPHGSLPARTLQLGAGVRSLGIATAIVLVMGRTALTLRSRPVAGCTRTLLYLAGAALGAVVGGITGYAVPLILEVDSLSAFGVAILGVPIGAVVGVVVGCALVHAALRGDKRRELERVVRADQQNTGEESEQAPAENPDPIGNLIRRFDEQLRQKRGDAVGCVAVAGATALVGPVLAAFYYRHIAIRPLGPLHPSDFRALVWGILIGASASVALAMLGWAVGWAVDRRLGAKRNHVAGAVVGDDGGRGHRHTGFVVGAVTATVVLLLTGTLMALVSLIAD
jgi:streptogramin lyase